MTRCSAAVVLVVLLLAGCSTPGPTTAAPTATVPTEPTPTAATPAESPGPARAYPVVREGDERLPGHTVLHPAGPVPFLLPIVVWGNGGCRQTNEEYRVFLTGLAAHGYLVVANGAPGNPFVHGKPEPAVQRPEALIAAVDWALAENQRAGSGFQGRLDPSRIALMGQSCGASEALVASADPRVDTTVAWNNGGVVGGLRRPTLFVTGGAQDYTGDSTRSAFAGAGVPAVLLDKSDGGHVGLWNDPALRPAALHVAERWLAFTLYDDKQARALFLGRSCGLCTTPTWTVTPRNWP